MWHGTSGRHSIALKLIVDELLAGEYLGCCGSRSHAAKGGRPCLAHLGQSVWGRTWLALHWHAHAGPRAVHAGRSTARHEHARRPTHASGGHALWGGLHVHAGGRPSHGPSRAHALRGPEGWTAPRGWHSTAWLPGRSSHELRGHAARWASHAWPGPLHAHGPWPGAHEPAWAHGAWAPLHAAWPHAAWRTLHAMTTYIDLDLLTTGNSFLPAIITGPNEGECTNGYGKTEG